MPFQKRIMLLGSGELGKELVISLKKLGQEVIAVDRYEKAPAHSVADHAVVIDMLEPKALHNLIQFWKPDLIVPEIEAIRTSKLVELETKGYQVIPSAKAVHLTMNRDAIRDLAAKKLKLKTARYSYASNLQELSDAIENVGYPAVVKPIMSSSGKGQSVVRKSADLVKAWKSAMANMRGDEARVIVEEFIRFNSEITLLTVKQKKGPTVFVAPIGHRQEEGDYRESWIPHAMPGGLLKKAKTMAKLITDELGGQGLFGVEFFLTDKEVYFSELSPRPHDTGLVTLTSQNLNEFDLHARAILGLPIPQIEYFGPSASRVVLASQEDRLVKSYAGIRQALSYRGVDVRIFDKKRTRKNRRMGVVLARASSVSAAKRLAIKAAHHIRVET